MDIRIDSETEGCTTIVHVSGRLEVRGAKALLKTCRHVNGALVLDLSGLVSADAEGLRALRELDVHGATLRDMAPFIRLLLDGLNTPIERVEGATTA